MIEEVVSSIRAAEEEAEALVQQANEEARVKATAASSEANTILEQADDEARAIAGKYRKMGDDFGKKKAAEILRIRKAEFEKDIAAARGRMPEAVAFILERIGSNGN